MSKPNVTKLIKTGKRIFVRNSPGILTGIGIAGMCTTVVLAVGATPKALTLIEKEKRRKNRELSKAASESGCEECSQINHLTRIETIKVAWKLYVPAAVTGLASVSCLLGANSVNARRNAALATAYNISRTALSEYKDKVVETIGEKKEQDIRDSIAKDKIEQKPASNASVIITNKGDTLCYDATSGRYFKSDIEKIRRVINELNRKMTYENYISLNELYDELGLRLTDIGEDLGWNIDDGLIDPEFSTQLADDGTPCIVVSYHVAPRYDYCRLM